TTPQDESQVGLAMTSAAFTRAQEANVVSVEADIDATTGLYLPATQLAEEHPQTANRQRLVSVADAIGVKALTEVTIEEWTEEGRRLHAAAYAGGLLLGQRPLVLGQKPGFGMGLVKGLAATPTEGKYARIVEEYRRNPDALPNPFIITYRRAPGTVVSQRR
ncbi:MAG: hypothetical protein ACREBW_01545, partial [Candidatus Micrarchaeaceae archaeon]